MIPLNDTLYHSGDPIGLQRLLLWPTAELSFEEKARQEELERNYTKRRG